MLQTSGILVQTNQIGNQSQILILSLANNTSQTEQNLLDEETDDKLIIDTKTEVVNSTSPESLDEETNEKLIIDAKTEVVD